MPLPLLAHQAPVLPLKLRWPSAWNGTALVVGSIAPDLEYLHPGPRSPMHSLLGQLSFCLPTTLVVVGIIGYGNLAAVLVARVPARVRPSVSWLVGAATDIERRGGVRRAVWSAAVGSLSHVALDRLTHTVLPSWLPETHPVLGRLKFSTAAIVQLVVSAGAALVSLWLLRELARSRTVDVPTSRPGGVLVVTCMLAGAAVGARLARPAFAHPDWYFAAGRLYVWGYAAFLVVLSAGVGSLVAGVCLAAWDWRANRLTGSSWRR